MARKETDYRYDPKMFRSPRGSRPPSEDGHTWSRLIVNLLALYGAIHLLYLVFRHFK